VQLQNDLSVLSGAGLGLAAISYDSAGVLRDFAQRRSITFPLLSDHESEAIRAYGVADRKYRQGMGLDVDTERLYDDSFGRVPVFGLSYAAVFVLTRDHRVKWRFVSENFELRLTGAAILEEAVGANVDQVRTPIDSRNIHITATATNAAVGVGDRIRIGLEFKIPKGFHIYSPEVEKGYIGVSWQMDDSQCVEAEEPVYPKPVWKHMNVADETLPVYEDTVRISRAISVRPGVRESDPSMYQLFCHLCVDPELRIHASGVAKFQACNEHECYPPQAVAVEWTFRFLQPDTQRSPYDLWREFEK
jgi:hypothetical protein